MNHPEDLSRRLFLQSAGALSGSTYLRILAPGIGAISQAACSARDEGAAFAVLGADEARDIAAIAARIIPTTDTPGAAEAGVIHFVDKAFDAEMSGQLDFARGGLAEFNQALAAEHGDTRFDELDEDAQDTFLATQEQTPFFEMMWVMTIFGFFSMPKYGGNRNKVGWDLVGFGPGHGPWTYPFGYYDAQVHGENSDGE
ncbi:MAG: gluconate 2-dehydrogenase subunit 3 family protein [Woeseiaceae bacterium]|nr:gluconate 2-dehydrogenase subunit 3 family protein [Woeseiaceae bacterium]